MNYKDELYHYGVKGMKWKNHAYKSDELYDRFMESKNDRQGFRLLKKYYKSTEKDINRDIKTDDKNTANRIMAGRTMAKMILDSNFKTSAVMDAAVTAKAAIGSDVVYSMQRNDKRGTVDITVNGKTSSYMFPTEKYKKSTFQMTKDGKYGKQR